MAEILGLGLSHYPPLSSPDSAMAGILRSTLRDPGIPHEVKQPSAWSQEARAEWGSDEGVAGAAHHRASLVAEFRKMRKALDDFQPDVVLIWGDDQYENFREDVIPAFTVCAYDDMTLNPWRQSQESSLMKGKPNAWNESPEKQYLLRGRRDIAKHLVTGLIQAEFDIAYAYQPLHHPGLAHAFTNAILYLDYDRTGWDYPIISVPINCYGRKVISARGFMTEMGKPLDLDPPGPSPRRCMDLGAATARILRESPWRVAVVASSSWSHAFLCDRTWRLHPDTQADRDLYRALRENDYGAWRSRTTEDFEAAGQQELLNWCPLLGAMEELGGQLDYHSFVETSIFNSNKVFAVYKPA